MATVKLERAPSLDGSSASNERLRLYLNRMVEALTYILANLDGRNIRDGGLTTAAVKGLDAQIVKAAEAQLGKIKVGAAQIQDLEAQVAKIITARIGTLDVDWAAIESLQASVAELVNASMESAQIGFAQIMDLVADKQIITQGEAGELYIADLAVTEANMVRLSIGQLMLAGPDGKFYEIFVDEETGAVTSRSADVSSAIEDGSIDAGEKLIDGSITAGKLNVQDIFADNAMIRELMAANIDVSTLFAREATISAINAMDLLANEQLRVYVSGQDALNAQIRAWFNFDDEGVLGIGRSDTAFSTTISFDELAFWYYSTKVAYMRGDRLHVPNAVIEESLTLGDLTAEVDGDYVVWS